MAIAWICLGLAGALEIAWMYFMKASDGFTKLWPSVGFGISSFASFWLLSYAVRTIPIGTGYAVWTGIGAVGAALLGMIFYKEPVSALRFLCLAFIIVGIIGLKIQHT
jgi:quaternary ammonium compound-resistance protein SugE